MKTLTAVLALGLGLGLGFALTAGAAPSPAPAVVRTIIDRVDIAPSQEAVQGRADIPPGGSTGWHTHSGIESGFIAEGTVEYLEEGRPARTLKPGDSFLARRGVPHQARNIGTGPARVTITWVVDKDKPLAEPATVK